MRYQAALHPDYGLTFIPNVTVDALAGERIVGHVSSNILGTALGALDFFLADFRDFHLDDKILFALFACMVVMWHFDFS